MLVSERISPAPDEQVEPRFQVGQHFRKCPRPQLRRGQLDGERQAVEPGADGRHHWSALRVEREAWRNVPRALRKEPERGALPCAERQRLHRNDALAANAEALPAGSEQAQPRTCRQQRGHGRSAGDDLLHVVDDEEHALVADPVQERLAHAEAAPFADADRRGHRGHDHLRIGHLAKRHEPDTLRKAVKQIGGGLYGEMRLADASRAGQREHARPYARQERHDLGRLGVTAKERRGEGGQIGGVPFEALQRWEIGREPGDDQL